jgi:hypothetical protein
MPCRVETLKCNACGGEHYYNNECLSNPSKYREGLSGYNPKTAAVDGKRAIAKAKAKEEVAAKRKRKAFNVAGALCDVLTLLEDKELLKTIDIPQDILDWWDGHQSREKDKVKKEALAKLSMKERRALGIE